MTLTLNHPFALRLPRFNPKRFSRQALVALVLVFTTIVVSTNAGCSTESTKQVVQDIANAIPTVQSDVAIASDIAQTLEPQVGLVIAGVTVSVQAGLTQLQVMCSTYANTADATIIGSIQSTLVSIMNTNAGALLDAAHIVDPTSRAAALKYLGLLQTALQLLYSIYQKISAKFAPAPSTTALPTSVAKPVAFNYKLKDVAPYLDHQRVEQATGYSFNTALQYEYAQGL